MDATPNQATANSIITQHYPIYEQTKAMRDQILALLTDADLRFALPGANVPFGVICRELGEAQHMYIQSFQTFTFDYTYRVDDPELETSVAKLKAWYAQLDADLRAALEPLSEADVQGKLIDRGGFSLPVMINFQVWREALLIFAAKSSLYLKAIERPVPQQVQMWIG
ncbi:MAG: hypothetical protein GYB67_07085 [Chloroflexi bacterium]|nr:hypothetical protein [Chloroflexota bacterium]